MQNRNNAPLPVPLESYSKKKKEDEAWSKAHKARVEVDALIIDKYLKEESLEVWELS